MSTAPDLMANAQVLRCLQHPHHRLVAARWQSPSCHSSPRKEVLDIVAALDDSGVPVIEVTHGDGPAACRSTTASPNPLEQHRSASGVETAKRAGRSRS